MADTNKNSNLEEAASAAAKAQALMEKHRIHKAMLNQVGEITWRKIEDKGKAANWKLYLVSQLARNNGCSCVRSEDYENDNTVSIVGEDQDQETVQQLYSYLVTELNNLCFVELITYFNQNNTYPDSKYTESWYLGAITTIGNKLETAKMEARNQAIKNAWSFEQRDQIHNALVTIDGKADRAKDWIAKNLDTQVKKENVTKPNPKGFVAGQVAGDQINIDPDQKAIE